MMDERMSLLEKNLSLAAFEKVKKRVHELYDSEWTQRLVAVEPEAEAAPKPAKIADVTPTKH